MTWPTNSARGSTNAFSPESMISKNLMDQALKSERDRIAQLNRNAFPYSSGSSNESNESNESNAKSSKRISHQFTSSAYNNRSKQQSFETSTNSKGSDTSSSLSGRVNNNTKKDCSLL